MFPWVPIIAAVAAITTAIIGAGSAKETSKRQSRAQSESEAKALSFKQQTQAREAARLKETQAREAERLKELEEKRSEGLRIEAQRYTIETLSDIFKRRSQLSAPMMIYHAPSAKTKSSIIDQVNRMIGRMLNA